MVSLSQSLPHPNRWVWIIPRLFFVFHSQKRRAANCQRTSATKWLCSTREITSDGTIHATTATSRFKGCSVLAASTIAQTLARADWSVQFLGQVKAGMLEQGHRETNPVCLCEGQTMFYSIKPCAAVLRAPPSCLNPLKLCFLKHDNRALKECGCRYPSCCNEPSIGRGLSRACGGRWEGRWVKRHF